MLSVLKTLIGKYKLKRRQAVLSYKVLLKNRKIKKRIMKVKYPILFKSSTRKKMKLIKYCNSEKALMEKALSDLINAKKINVEKFYLELKNLSIRSVDDCMDFFYLYGKLAVFLQRLSSIMFIPVTKAPFYLNLMEFFSACGFLLLLIKICFS